MCKPLKTFATGGIMWMCVMSFQPLTSQLYAQLDDATAFKEPTVNRPNLATKTLGGTQFWSDVYVVHGWRIQVNVITKHHRLLDDKNVRRAWGPYHHCRNVFDKHRTELKLPALQGKAVLVLHGLGRTQKAMRKMSDFLDEQSEFHVVNVSYASGRLSIDQHAANLQRIVEALREEGVDEISFVAHSLGNLVVRYYLGIQADQLRAQTPHGLLPRCERIVMLSPPNQGSRFAELLKKNTVFRLFAGESGQQIADFEQLAKRLATPVCEFGIIAGGRGKTTGRNPILSGDDDLVVSVEETRLSGASDFLVIPALHTFIMNDAKAQEATLRFLQHGYLVAADKRQPIE